MAGQMDIFRASLCHEGVHLTWRTYKQNILFSELALRAESAQFFCITEGWATPGVGRELALGAGAAVLVPRLLQTLFPWLLQSARFCRSAVIPREGR